jgi:hypothetical protein
MGTRMLRRRDAQGRELHARREAFKATGKGYQTRMNAVLETYATAVLLKERADREGRS